ncbi:MAG: PAS domain S-box-containing protein [Arenicella sp.]
MSNSENIELLKNALKREKRARIEAEQLLESKAMELYDANLALKNLNDDLERKLESRIEQIKQTEFQFEKVVSEADDVIYKVNLNGEFTYVNKAAINLTKYSENELIGMSFGDLVISPSKEIVGKFYKEQLENNTDSIYYEFEIKTKKNERYWLGQNIQIILINNEVVGFLGIARNISDRVKSDQLLRKSEEKYRQILENMELGIIEVDLNERITKVYDSFCQLTGYSHADLINKNPRDLLPTDESIHIMDIQNEFRRNGEASVYEVQIEKKNGDFIWVLISGAPYFNEFGELIGSIGVHLDITDRKISETELEKARDSAEASSKAKELFLANMSHEIRTPLNAVIGVSQLLAKTGLNNSQSEHVEMIKRSAGNLLSLVNNILDFSKIEAGEMLLEKESVDLNILGKNLIELFSYKATEQNIEIFFSRKIPAGMKVIADRLRLSQILMNLVNNAVKFTNEGSVELIINQISDSKFHFEVKDTGVGISKSNQKVIFQKFRQEEESTGRKFGGTGLGLNIARSIVELYGGQLELKSEKGTGSSFFFNLELEIFQDHKTELQNTKFDTFPWQDIHILLAEDNKVNQFVAAGFIEEWGARLTICENGLEAFQLVEKQDFDLILMDIQMPIMNGLDATFEIRMNLNSQIPIIALTANAVKGDREKFLKAGMNDHISKPFDEVVLQRAIAELISKDKAQKSNSPPVKLKSLMDISKLKALEGANLSFIPKMLQLFVEESHEQLKEIDTLVDFDSIAALAHKIKPSFDYLASRQLTIDVRLIEDKEFVKDWSLLSKFILDWRKLVQEVENYLSNIES